MSVRRGPRVAWPHPGSWSCRIGWHREEWLHLRSEVDPDMVLALAYCPDCGTLL